MTLISTDSAARLAMGDVRRAVQAATGARARRSIRIG
jgi:hypothetical protein